MTEPPGSSTHALPDVEITRADDADLGEIVDLAQRVLQWPDGPHRDFFAWKHRENPFGRSPLWLARSGGTLAGFRTFLRWRWRRGGPGGRGGSGGEVSTAVRAVDTVTDPAFARRGIFRRLTVEALAGLADEGVGFVFNTPNDKSRPGYLQMGWDVVGRPRVAVRPRRVGALVRVARSRKPAAKWSIDLDVGRPVVDALATATDDGLRPLFDGSDDLATDRSTAFLRWRYGFEALHYRLLTLDGAGVETGFVVVRARERAGAVEGVVCDVLVPDDDPRRRHDLLRVAADRLPADYLLIAAEQSRVRWGWFPAPRQGPVLCWRAVSDPRRPRLDGWGLTLGDLELF